MHLIPLLYFYCDILIFTYLFRLVIQPFSGWHFKSPWTRRVYVWNPICCSLYTKIWGAIRDRTWTRSLQHRPLFFLWIFLNNIHWESTYCVYLCGTGTAYIVWKILSVSPEKQFSMYVLIYVIAFDIWSLKSQTWKLVLKTSFSHFSTCVTLCCHF